MTAYILGLQNQAPYPGCDCDTMKLGVLLFVCLTYSRGAVNVEGHQGYCPSWLKVQKLLFVKKPLIGLLPLILLTVANFVKMK